MNQSSRQALVEVGVESQAKRVRVLHLHAGNLYGGVETLLVAMARLQHLCPGMEPHFALCYSGRLSIELTAAGVPVHMLGEVRLSRPWTAWHARRRLRELLSREHFDAAICHMPWPMVVFGSTVQSFAPLVFWAHSYHSGKSWLERMARRITPDLAISTSRYVGSSITNLYPAVRSSIVYCPLALADSPEASHWRVVMRRNQGVDDDTVVIVQVSRFEWWKGHLLHLEALSRLKSIGKWVCWIVGGPQNPADQEHYDKVTRAVERLGLTDRVRFLGQRSDVPQLLAGADIFCQPNEGPEPFGIVFVEALWAGRPVVSTAMGGALEIVDESCGLLAEPGNAENLAELLARLINSADLRVRLGQAGRKRALELCDPAAQLRNLYDLMREPVQKRNPGHAQC
ncbi:MAG TPA: glycosyltransferase family 4 protein [Bryobacteraceae bacterium]|nr:glycosyltransferase family 4 protein [Bryobacteraceae bacterium]